MINFEGGAIPEEYHMAYIVDRVNTTGTVFMGLTVGCAQCHDHKFDALTQKEYYQLYAFFYNVPENGLDGRTGNAAPLLKTPTAEQQKRLDELQKQTDELERRLAGPHAEIDAAQQEWEAKPDATPKLPENIQQIIALETSARSKDQQVALRTYYRANVSPEGKKWQGELTALRDQRTAVDKQIPSSMIMQEMTPARETRLLIRGQYDKKGDAVTAAVPLSLPQLPKDAPANRLGLAQWLVSPEHPLMSRVTVNRFWQLVFGAGLVRSSEDFGSQGDVPSHPELLDWLAAEFMQPTDPQSAAKWDVKALLRLMVTSATYRQQSAVTRDLLAKDPENRLLARGTRHRLQVEFIRDQALFVSGLLDKRVGGSSVSPYQPAGLWEELMARADGKNWTAQEYLQSHGPDLYRRTMYTFWKRTCPPPSLVTFDAPDRETCTVRRSRTNTPLQALVLLNDPTYVEASRKLAERIMLEGGDSVETRINFAFRVVLTRQPRPQEISVLKNIHTQQLEKFRQNETAAQKLLKVGESPRNEQLDVVELATWATISGILLNLDETVTKG